MLKKASARIESLKNDQNDSPAPEASEEAPPKIESKGSAEREELPAPETEKDYLQKYQYKKQILFGSLATNPTPGTKKYRMKQKLLMQPRVRIIIPRAPKEPAIVKLSVNLNGYRLDFPKQEYIEVPEQVAKIIMKSQRQTEEALSFRRLDAGSTNKADKEALNL